MGGRGQKKRETKEEIVSERNTESDKGRERVKR